MDENIVGTRVVTTTHCEIGENELWNVEVEIVQKRLFEGEEEWESKSVTMKANAKELEVAVASAIVSLDMYLTPRGNDLFSEAKVLPVQTESGEYIN